MLKGLVDTISRKGVWLEPLNVICGAVVVLFFHGSAEDKGLDSIDPGMLDDWPDAVLADSLCSLAVPCIEPASDPSFRNVEENSELARLCPVDGRGEAARLLAAEELARRRLR
jgi:hypothetical protein